MDPGDGHVHIVRNESSGPAETMAVQLLPLGRHASDRRARARQLPLLTTRRTPSVREAPPGRARPVPGLAGGVLGRLRQSLPVEPFIQSNPR